MNEQGGSVQDGRDESIWRMLGGSFRGPMGWMAVVAWMYSIGFTVIGVLAAVWFFRAETTRDQLLYATVFLTAMMFVSVIKLWYWGMMMRGGLKRDLDRLERKIDQLGSGGA